jgi:hypothetical protein
MPKIETPTPITRKAKEAVELPQLRIMFSEQSVCPERTVLLLKFAPRFSMNCKPRLACTVHELLNDLKNEAFSPKPVTDVIEPVRALKNEPWSAEPEVEPTKAPR